MKRSKSIFLVTLLLCMSMVSVAFGKDVISSDSSVVANSIVSISTDISSVTIAHEGASEFIKVTGHCVDGTEIDITENAKWESADSSVVWAYDGRVLARDYGSTSVKISYGDYSISIPVVVQKNVDIKSITDNFVDNYISNSRAASLLSLTTSERNSFIEKARNMVYLQWGGTKNLVGWRGEYIFYSSAPHQGIPYSQTEYQVDDIQFMQRLNNSSSGFYDSYTRFGIKMPKYGNDCSGFVSFAWGISRHTTDDFRLGIETGKFKKLGSYDTVVPSYNDLYNSYQYLQPGDAVVKRGHTFLIISTSASGKYAYCYEQTPYYAIATFWTYEDMARQGYMPFSKK